MPSTDDRIVRMEFDNASFEKKISSTLTSLSQLDKALKFTGASQGLSDISSAAEKVNFGGMGNALEDVSKKFIALSTIAITALANITTKALEAGAQLAKSFTIQPILDGFREYETQLNSIQTILANTASKGTTLDQVTEALGRLNTYSDQTIYNFGQMAKNIGTFTAAGVDLETSVQSIKGIANLAAMSGSNAEQASTAMYQLSQAIASGSLKLMDWNSVVNAGMGGEAFKSALFETGKAMGTLLDVPMTQTFKEWEDSGHSFRDSLQDGWITADVLTTTLSGFTGDLTEEMLVAKGFSEDAAQNILKTAAIAKAAATEVKTFTQLVGTVKEAVGTGWADSFKIIIGNFTEAKELWTGVNNAIGKFVQQNSDARNAILEGWKAFGGRTTLIDSFKVSFQNLGEILAPIREAFQNIFPPVTAETLLKITDALHRFAEALKPNVETVDKIRSIFQGLFSVLSIGWEVIKEGAKFIIDLGKSLLGLVTPGVTGFLAKLGDGLTKLHEALVTGGGIKDFFAGLTKILEKPIELLGKVKDAIGNIFDLFDDSIADKVTDSVGRLGDRFAGLKGVFESAGRLWEPFENALRKIVDVLDKVWDVISTWFKELGSKLAGVMGQGDFNAVLDMINVGLLGGIVVLLRKFFKEGLKIDLGGGFFEKISGVLDQVTNSLKAMQMNIKANALLKIAGAIGILTASVLVLSMIDSVALSKALGAMAVGFGELMATFSVFTKIASSPTSAASFTIMSVGLILLSTALLILSGVVAIFAQLSWEEIAKGLSAITSLLGILMVTTKPLAANAKGMITAGIGISAIAVALTILGVAMKIFATMSWEEIGKGLAVVAASLLIIAGVMQMMPSTLPITAAGLILVAIAMTILSGAMLVFGHMKWDVIGRGLVAMGGGLLIIAGAMQMMPATLPITAAGLILVGIALGEIAIAMKLMGKMSWAEIARGLTALAGSLLILAVGLQAMQAGITGALALIVAASALVILAGALKLFGKMDWGELIDGLLKVALALGAFALISVLLQPAVGAMIALGAALVVLGIGFALVGAGAYLVAKAFETFAKAGEAGVSVVAELLKVVAEGLPDVLKALAKGVVDAILVFAKSAPILAEALGKLLGVLLDQLVVLIPKALVVIGQLISGILGLIREKGPEYIATGLFILTKLLEGIRDNIKNIVVIVSAIITNFLDEFAKQIDGIVDSVINLYITFLMDVAEGVGRVAGTILFGVGEAFIKGFLEGVESSAESGPMRWFMDLAGEVIRWIGNVIKTLWDKGTDFITGLLEGITNKAFDVIMWFASLPGKIFDWIGNVLDLLVSKGADIIGGLLNGAQFVWGFVTGWIGDVIGRLGDAISRPHQILADIGEKIMDGLWNGLKSVWHRIEGWLGGLKDIITSIKGPPSDDAKMLVDNGMLIMQGLWGGMEDEWAHIEKWLGNLDPAEYLDNHLSDNMLKTVNGVLQSVLDSLGNDIDMSPVITPVLDLTNLRNGASQIAGYIPATTTYGHAQVIAKQQTIEPIHPAEAASSGGVNFNQVINAPTQLSTSDIYKHTRNQITIAKEELSIP